MGERPDYGPQGYLPPKAAKRARKIMLREPLGLTWVVASVIAALVLVGVGIAYLVVWTGPPGPPHEQVAPVEAVDPRGAEQFDAGAVDVLIVRGGGGVHAFLAPEAPATWCQESGRIEATDGQVWEISGRLVGGEGSSLQRVPVEAHDGVLYVDPTAPSAPPAPANGDEDPVCVGR